MKICEKIAAIRQQIPQNVRLVCVSKFHPESAILEAYVAGERDFGESRAQELVRKAAALPRDIRWHFIGSLQTNKVKMVVPLVHLIHGVDSEKLLETIDKFAAQNNRICNVLFEVHVAKDATKHGFSFVEIEQFFATEKWKNFPNVRICGLMGMATLDASEEQTRCEFEKLHQLFEQTKRRFECDCFTELSMGMSGDFPLAVAAGSTCVRVGISIFGERT